MRHLAWILIIAVSTSALAAPRLSRETARRRISEFVSSKLLPDAIEIRRIVAQGGDSAVAETTITLAFQFRKDPDNNWTVDSIRLGDRDWVSMAELLAAIRQAGAAPAAAAATNSSPTPPPGTDDTPHANPTVFEKARQRMRELGASPLLPAEIEIRRVSSQSDTRTIAEATILLGFRFTRNDRSGGWTIDAARLGEGAWVDTGGVLATLNDGRRRATLSMMQKLVQGIERYRLEDGNLPPARNILELTDVLHPHYMTDLVREDGWGQPLDYEVSGFTFRVVSKGSDGRRGTPDDIVAP